MPRPKRNRRGVAAPSTSPPPEPSVRYNNLSILRNIDLSSIPTIRALMSCLATEIQDPAPIILPIIKDHVESFGLPETAAGPVYIILCAISDNGGYDLLKRAVIRFTEGNKGSDEEVLRAVHELEELTEEKVLRSPSLNIVAYEKALEKFEYEKRTLPVRKKQVKDTPVKQGSRISPKKKRKLENHEGEYVEEISEEPEKGMPVKRSSRRLMKSE